MEGHARVMCGCDKKLLHRLMKQHNLSHAELARKCNISSMMIFRLINGEISPLYKSKKKEHRENIVRPWVYTLCGILHVTPEYIWPMFEELTIEKIDLIEDIAIPKTYSERIAEHMHNGNHINRLFVKDIIKYLTNNPRIKTKSINMFIEYYINDATLEDVSQLFKCTRENIRIVLDRVLTIIKQYCKKNAIFVLLNFSDTHLSICLDEYH